MTHCGLLQSRCRKKVSNYYPQNFIHNLQDESKILSIYLLLTSFLFTSKFLNLILYNIKILDSPFVIQFIKALDHLHCTPRAPLALENLTNPMDVLVVGPLTDICRVLMLNMLNYPKNRRISENSVDHLQLL